MCLHKFEIYQGIVAPNSFKSRTNFWYPDFFQKNWFCLMSDLKFTLSDVTSFLQGNLSGLKKLYLGLLYMRLTSWKGKLFLSLNALNNMKTKILKDLDSLRSQGILVWKLYRMLYFDLVWYAKQKLAWPHILFCYILYKKFCKLLTVLLLFIFPFSEAAVRRCSTI